MELLFDKEQFTSLMHDFYVITKIKIVFYDVNLNPVISIPDNDCTFCTALKKNSSALYKCNKCIENEVLKCKKQNKLNIYKCHSGLVEAVAPVKIDDVILGYIMFGQIIDKNDRQNKKEQILSYVSEYCREDMERHFNKITAKSVEQIQATAKFLEMCVSYLAINNLSYSVHTGFAFKISNYISENISSDLSVEKLCRVFDISRNSLYRIFNDFYGMSVAKYIRKKRIDAAKKLIEKGTSITEASSLVGFYDYNYFSKVFKSETGILPSKYRKTT